MADSTVQQLADKLSMDVTALLKQLKGAGLSKSEADVLSEVEKESLLKHLKTKTHSASTPGPALKAAPERITLRRKRVSEKEITGPQGGKRRVQVEVRKTRTYAKRPPVSEALEPELIEEQVLLDEVAPEPVIEEVSIVESQESVVATTDEVPEVTLESTLDIAVEPAVLEAEFVDVEYAKESASPVKKEVPKDKKDKVSATTEKADKSDHRGKDKAGKRRVGGVGGHHRRGEEGEDGSGAGRGGALTISRHNTHKRKKRGSARTEPSGQKHGFELPVAPMVREVLIPRQITVGELAQRMAVKASEVIRQLMKLGMMMSINQAMDQDTAVLIVEELGHKFKLVNENALEDSLVDEWEAGEGERQPRAPVVTIMGHVDHGKTSLLDYIRRTKVAASESGGITQHIGAYNVKMPNGSITFLDTPGHAAFTAMRARGANCTDIVILVVAADDGVMPQTIEAIQHAKAAGVPLIIAMNKMDKENADPDKVKSALSQYEVTSEEWGGDTQFVGVSAKTGQGVDELLESILVQSEILELKAVPVGPAKGVVIESRLDKGRGAVATVLVQAGTLKKGDLALAGTCYGRIRAMTDVTSESLLEAGPSMPVEILGLSGVPNAGDELVVVRDERKAREVAAFRQAKLREKQMALSQNMKLESLMGQMTTGVTDVLNVVLKADVQGSAEALASALQQLSQAEVSVRLIVAGVGGITESDVNLAVASRALILGFNVRADATARKIAEAEGLQLRYYSIIYDLIDDVKQAMSGLLKPEVREQIVGVAQVRDVFRSSKFGAIAGCMVQEGIVKRHHPIRVLRNHVVVFEGELESLRRFKEDVNEVRNGMECGIGVKNYVDVQPGDQIEIFERITVERVLS